MVGGSLCVRARARARRTKARSLSEEATAYGAVSRATLLFWLLEGRVEGRAMLEDFALSACRAFKDDLSDPY
jgi:hypothetical protein